MKKVNCRFHSVHTTGNVASAKKVKNGLWGDAIESVASESFSRYEINSVYRYLPYVFIMNCFFVLLVNIYFTLGEIFWT